MWDAVVAADRAPRRNPTVLQLLSGQSCLAALQLAGLDKWHESYFRLAGRQVT